MPYKLIKEDLFKSVKPGLSGKNFLIMLKRVYILVLFFVWIAYPDDPIQVIMNKIKKQENNFLSK